MGEMASTCTLLGVALLCLLSGTCAIKFYKYGQCVHSSPCASVPTNGLVDDWALLVATAPAQDNLLSFWGPTFVGCDTNSLQETCCNQGIYYLSGDDNTNSTGYVYGYNKELQKWTIENFVTIRSVVPGTNLTAYETFYYNYISIDNNIIFKDGKCVAYSGSEIVFNPMLRKVRWVLLESDQNKSYRILLNCENVDGFLYNGSPQIQIYVKRSAIASFSKVSEISALTIYDSIEKTLKNQKLNPANIQWRIVKQDLPSPTDTLYNSINWDNCKCKKTGTFDLLATEKAYY